MEEKELNDQKEAKKYCERMVYDLCNKLDGKDSKKTKGLKNKILGIKKTSPEAIEAKRIYGYFYKENISKSEWTEIINLLKLYGYVD